MACGNGYCGVEHIVNSAGDFMDAAAERVGGVDILLSMPPTRIVDEVSAAIDAWAGDWQPCQDCPRRLCLTGAQPWHD